MFPRDLVIGSLAKYEIEYSDDEETESLVDKLAQFYANRTLPQSPITPADQEEAYFLLVSERLSKTTGQVITVDGRLHEAFLRQLASARNIYKPFPRKSNDRIWLIVHHSPATHYRGAEAISGFVGRVFVHPLGDCDGFQNDPKQGASRRAVGHSW